jgi:DivIVA domain-containing protein
VTDDKDSQESRGPEPAGSETEPTELMAVGELRDEVPTEIRDVAFPGAMRGYERRAVDAYVKRVNRVIAELEVSRSPQAAIRDALDRVGQQTTGVMQHAREVADELTATALAESEHTTTRARVEAEEVLEEAKEDAEELIAQARKEAAARLRHAEEQLRTAQDEAEGRLRDLKARTAGAEGAHRQVLEELRQLAAELEQLASERSAPSADASDETVELPHLCRRPPRRRPRSGACREAHGGPPDGDGAILTFISRGDSLLLDGP